MTVAEARKALVSSIRSLRTMEQMHCSIDARASAALIVEGTIDDLIEAAQREVVRAEQAGLAEAASLAAEVDRA